jgi:hypothetical protein
MLPVFDEALGDALTRAEAGKASVGEAVTIRRSFAAELRLEKNPEPWKTALVAYDRRIAHLQKQQLLAGAKATATAAPTTNDDMLRETTAIQKRTTDSLQRTLARANESRAVANETAAALADQDDTLHRIEGGVKEVQTELARANEQLDGIFRRMASDKVLCCMLVIFLIVLVATIVVVAVSHKGGSTPTTTTTPNP